MDRPGVRQVPEGSGELGKMEKSGCKIICLGSDDDDDIPVFAQTRNAERHSCSHSSQSSPHSSNEHMHCASDFFYVFH